jgi:hypothetical protein
MLICRNPKCARSYLSDDGKIVANLVRELHIAHDANPPVNPPLVLRQLAPRIYQNGELACAGCGQVTTLAHHTGPTEPQPINTLLENIELLLGYGVLPAS